MESNRFSIVDYASMQTKGRCGYCSSKNGSLSYGNELNIKRLLLFKVNAPH